MTGEGYLTLVVVGWLLWELSGFLVWFFAPMARLTRRAVKEHGWVFVLGRILTQGRYPKDKV